MSTAQPLVETLLNEAIFQRSRRDYALALGHLEQVIEIDPKNSEAHQELGRTLSYFAAESSHDKKKTLLDRAELALQRALELPDASKQKCFHDLGWVYDERGEFDKAVEMYRKAQQAYKEFQQARNREATPPEALSKVAVSEAALAYNLACALAKAGRQREAIAELRGVIKDAWKWAEKDPDFAAIRESAEWGPQFQELIASARDGRIG